MSSISLSQAHETKVTLEKAGATVENFWNPLAQSVTLASMVVQFIATTMRVVFTLKVGIDRDMTGWTKLGRITTPKEGEKFVPVMEKFHGQDKYVSGDEMVECAERSPSYPTGLWHAEAMLREQSRIPVWMRDFFLVFPEVWHNPQDNRGVFCLTWEANYWCLQFRLFGKGFDSKYRLISIQK